MISGRTQNAIGIAVSERLYPSVRFVDVDVMVMPCPHCGDDINRALVVARIGIVGLLWSIKVFNAAGEDHAERIAKSVIDRVVRNVPLATYRIVSCGTGMEME